MDIQDAVRERRKERRSHQSHEPCKADEIYLPRVESSGKRAIVSIAAGVLARPEAERVDSGVGRSFQSCRILPVRDDDRDLGVETTLFDCVDDRLEIRSAPRNQYTDAPVGKGDGSH